MVVTNNSIKSAVAASGGQPEIRPGVFVFGAGGNKYAAALVVHSTGRTTTSAPPRCLDPRSRRGQPVAGETLELCATGLGPTNPAVPAGTVFSGAASLVDAPTVTIGGVPAQVSFAGLVSAGLYQLNVTVPNLPEGDQPLLVKVNGAPSQPGVLVSISN